MPGVVHNTAQKLFKRIVVHNKIMDEATADRLLVREPDPDKLIRLLVQQEKLKKEVGQQLLTLYRRQLEKQGEGSAPAQTAVAADGNGSSTQAPGSSATSSSATMADVDIDALLA